MTSTGRVLNRVIGSIRMRFRINGMRQSGGSAGSHRGNHRPSLREGETSHATTRVLGRVHRGRGGFDRLEAEPRRRRAAGEAILRNPDLSFRLTSETGNI